MPLLAAGLLLLLGAPASADSGRFRRLEQGYAAAREQRFEEAALHFRAALEAGPEDARVRTDLGYALLSAGKRAEAYAEFEAALAREPASVLLLKQLGYLDIDAGRHARAAERFAKVHALAPEDHEAALQLGYLYDRLGRRVKAEKAFLAAARSPDPRVRESAEGALRVVRSALRRFYLDLFASPVYMARFGNLVGHVEAQAHAKPWRDGPLSFYIGARLIDDTRSRGGTAPQIYSDHVFSSGPGLRLQLRVPGVSASVSAESFVAVNLLRDRNHPNKTEGDHRVTLNLYRDFSRERHQTELGASLGYYSRFDDNWIGYASARRGWHFYDDGRRRASVFLIGNAAADANEDFFNNFGEFGPGLELRPWLRENLKIRAEFLHGVYFGREGKDPNPYGARYQDFRVTVLYGARF